MFDELSEADFNREDPFKAVHEKKDTGNTNATLNKYEIGEELSETQQRKEQGKEQVWQSIGLYCTLGLIIIGALSMLWVFFEADNKTRIAKVREDAVEAGEDPDLAQKEEQAVIAIARIFMIILISMSSLYFVCAATFFYLPLTSAILALLLFILQNILYIIAFPLTLVYWRDWIIRAALFGGFVQAINNAAYYSYIKKQKD